MNPLDHPDGCSCGVCKRHRQRLQEEPAYRELHAEQEPEPEPATEAPQEQSASSETVVVEHHHHHHHESADPSKRSKPGKSGKDGKKGKDGKRGRPGHRRSILRTLAVGAILVWLLNSFYPDLDVPLVPGISCTDPGTTVPAVAADPTWGLPPTPHFFYNPFSTDKKLKDLTEETIGGAAKKFGLALAGGALHLAGETVRAAAAHPPKVEDVRAGLYTDAEQVGKVIGFVWGAVGGTPIEDMADMNTATAASDGCSPCLTAAPVSGSGAASASQAARQVGFSGESLVTAVAVSLAESGARSVRGARNSNGTYDYGYWQINSVHSDLLARYNWRDPVDNARMAWEISGHGTNWTPWTTYRDGAYRAHLSEAQAAVGGSDLQPVAASYDPGVSDYSKTVHTQPVALRAASFIRSHFGFKGTIGGSADSGHITNSYHYRGLALDVMTTDGQAIYDYFSGPGYGLFNVDNVIFRHQIYNAGRGQHYYSGTDHFSHVHIDFHSGTSSVPTSTSVAACTTPPGGVIQTSAAVANGLRVATFNVWGASHTWPGRGGDHASAPDWDARWPGEAHYLSASGASVVGFQEMQAPQLRALQAEPGWSTYAVADNVIGWRSDTWRPLAHTSVEIPYFFGRPKRMPIVQLENRSGLRVWFLSVHNPADAHGPAGKWRSTAVQAEARTLARLSGPVVWMGDFNEQRTPEILRRYGFLTATDRGIDYVASKGIGLAGGTRIEDTKRAGVSDHAIVTGDLTATGTA